MKFSFKWLKELVLFPWSHTEFADRLTMAGIEVEDIQIQGKGFDQVVVAQILQSNKHPNADRLSVCEIETGSGKKQIVCGAKNYQVGDKVPLALAGAILPNGMEIKRSKLRGVESDGMMCSSKELGLAEDTQGLMILPNDLKVGTPLTEALGLNDTLFDLEITPNRPDLLSHWGLAREIAALANLPPPNPQQLLSSDSEKSLDQTSHQHKDISIRVENPTECPRYTARIIRGVQVGPSPEWLRRRLESLGQRSISNVVDITNYVLQEIGQPLHAFDLKLLEGPEIIVRHARTGEKLVRLDGETSELKPEMLVIADSRKPVALAGVIGGMETAVSNTTTDILLESATFQSSIIRKTSKTLGVLTDSSYCFERGVDIELASWGSLRATFLILQICGGQVEGPLVDVRNQPAISRKILCRLPKIESLLGISISSEDARAMLKRLGCKINDGSDSKTFEVIPPSYRLDLEREVDLAEEIARIYGIGKIPETLRAWPLSTTKDSPHFLVSKRLRSLATSLGLDEVSNYSIISSAKVKEPNDLLKLANPLSSEMDLLRPSLFPGLLETATRNLAGRAETVAFFELGKIFEVKDGKVTERPSFGIILSGLRADGASWENGIQGKPFDFFDLKGMIDEILEQFGLQEIQKEEIHSKESTVFELEPGMGFILSQNGQVVGHAGKIKSSQLHGIKSSTGIFYAELNGPWLLETQKPEPRYQPWTIYPAIRRDISMTVQRKEKFQTIEQNIRQLAKKHAESKGIFLQYLELFDIFASDKIGEDKKSLALSMTYRSAKKTLTDQEVNDVYNTIKNLLKAEIECELRE